MFDRKNIILQVIFASFVFAFGGYVKAAYAAPVDTPILDTPLPTGIAESVGDAVVEVIVPKPETDSLQYEKPLPLDLIPYSIRTDKYYSIGTAFAISPSHFLSAAHVMPLGMGSQFNRVFVRDRKGKVYSVDRIIKYSQNRDFVVFTVKGWKAAHALTVNTMPKMNEKIYAVGNALAQGIVIRDGLYTSNTPEEEAGKWQWIRFSAAASPGNSGGPLLDKNGSVIGVILRKSENENLNYALPIAEVMDAPQDLAVMHMKMKYFLDNMDMTVIDTFHEEIRLPKMYEQLDSTGSGAFARFSESLLKKLLSENRQNIFPNGSGSTALLNKSYNAVFPQVIMKDEDGNWEAFSPKNPSDSDLGKNGFLRYGGVGSTFYFYIHKPDDVPLKTFMTDSKLFMDLLLKGVYVYRAIGSEKIKIVSMGKAREEYQHTDSYGRKWTVRTWRQEYNDQIYAVFSLPVPGGCIALLRLGQTGHIYSSHIPDMKMLTDFIYFSYYGTFKEWREFLALKDMQPAIFNTLDIRIEPGRMFGFTSRRFAASYGPDLMSVTDKSDLSLQFTYFRDQGKAVWDLDGIVIGDDKSNKISYSVFRYAKPPQELPDKFHSAWKNLVEKRFPFNRSAYHKEEYTYISTSYGENASRKGSGSEDICYSVAYSAQGKAEQSRMEEKLDGFLRNLRVFEITGESIKTGKVQQEM